MRRNSKKETVPIRVEEDIDWTSRELDKLRRFHEENPKNSLGSSLITSSQSPIEKRSLLQSSILFSNSEEPKSSLEMMKGLLKGSPQAGNADLISKNEKQRWGELLTNRYKLQAYKVNLLQQIEKDAGSAPQLRLLSFLLGEMEQTSIDVHYGDEMHLEFNQGAIRKQAQEIDQLHEGRQKLERELEEVSREYEKILFNFNVVIQNLMQKESRLSVSK